MVNQRYVLKRDRIFLDTKPGLAPDSLPELPGFLLPYLHLSAYPLHVPRVYAILRASGAELDVKRANQLEDRLKDEYVLMLESSALAIAAQPSQSATSQSATSQSAAEVPELLPTLSSCWSAAPPLRQLNWLWQIAQVWDAFYAEQVTLSLLDNALLRVDGSLLRLLALSDAQSPLPPSTLIDLARSWQPLVESAHPAVRPFLERLCEQLERQQISAEQLSEQLAQAMTVCAQEQGVRYDLATYTDQGPTRKRNEDACYPASGTHQGLTSEETRQTPQLLIVCDGIGGHQGGDVASKLAISTIEARLLPLLVDDQPELSATELILSIESAICAANDEISAQNDRHQRQARDRMGTTLVMALIKGADVYIAHLGDSRAYRIGANNCQQVTLDDDVASRQVRLGGSLYREVLMQPGSGSLIQALGMGSSQSLRPTVQRFVIDESCMFLLCSDGLSDGDRVEQFWPSVLWPLVLESGSVAEVGKQLVDLANKYNGHDNVTVGLLNAQVVRVSDRIVPRVLSRELPQSNSGASSLESTLADASPKHNQTGNASAPLSAAPIQTRAQTKLMTVKGDSQISPKTSNKTSKLPITLAALAIMAAIGTALYLLVPIILSDRFSPSVEDGASSSPADTAAPNASTGVDPVTGTSPSPAQLTLGSYARIQRSDNSLALYLSPVAGRASDPNVITGSIPTGSIVQVISKQTTDDQSEWVQVKLCSIPSGANVTDAPAETDLAETGSGPADNSASTALNQPESVQTEQPLILPPGSEGWVVESRMANVSESIQDLQPTQKGRCGS